MNGQNIEAINAKYAKIRAIEAADLKRKQKKAGFARWGNSHAIEGRKQISVTASLVAEFYAAYPESYRRAGADYGIRKAIDDAAQVIAFHDSFKDGPKEV